MQFALASAEAFPAQHGASPAKADVENAPAASRANVVLIMCTRQHRFTDVQPRRRRQRALHWLNRRSDLLGGKLELPIFFVHLDGLPLAEFSLQDIEAQGIEQIALNDALQRPCTINRIITFPCEQAFCRLRQLEYDVLLGKALG